MIGNRLPLKTASYAMPVLGLKSFLFVALGLSRILFMIVIFYSKFCACYIFRKILFLTKYTWPLVFTVTCGYARGYLFIFVYC